MTPPDHFPHFHPLRSALRRSDQDLEFLARDELRAIRLQLDWLKPELIQQAEGIASTIVVFGSSRLPELGQAQKQLHVAQATLAEDPHDADRQRQVKIAQSQVALARYYDEAREFSQLVSSTCQVENRCEYVIVTGGGSGIMEAANRGAHDVGAKSIGLNIALPHEQVPNAYITPSLCFEFRYFALRKMHFLYRATALVAFSGGYGTLDELFETLTLIQTGKVKGVVVVLVGRDFWQQLINWPMLVETGLISAEDLQLFHFAETAQEVWDIILANHSKADPS